MKQKSCKTQEILRKTKLSCEHTQFEAKNEPKTFRAKQNEPQTFRAKHNVRTKHSEPQTFRAQHKFCTKQKRIYSKTLRAQPKIFTMRILTATQQLELCHPNSTPYIYTIPAEFLLFSLSTPPLPPPPRPAVLPPPRALSASARWRSARRASALATASAACTYSFLARSW